MFCSKSFRKEGWDYSSEGNYFITVYTLSRKPYLGRIENGKMILSKIGFVAKDRLSQIPLQNRHMEIREFQFMPDHIHFIIRIKHRLSQTAAPQKGTNSMSKGSIPLVVNHFKAKVKSWCNSHGVSEFCWKENFLDHVVKDEEEYEKIVKYIMRNPLRWERKQMVHL